MEDSGDGKIRQMVEAYYGTITQELVDQSNECAIDWKIVSNSIRNAGFGSKGKRVLKCER